MAIIGMHGKLCNPTGVNPSGYRADARCQYSIAMGELLQGNAAGRVHQRPSQGEIIISSNDIHSASQLLHSSLAQRGGLPLSGIYFSISCP